METAAMTITHPRNDKLNQFTADFLRSDGRLSNRDARLASGKREAASGGRGYAPISRRSHNCSFSPAAAGGRRWPEAAGGTCWPTASVACPSSAFGTFSPRSGEKEEIG